MSISHKHAINILKEKNRQAEGLAEGLCNSVVFKWELGTGSFPQRYLKCLTYQFYDGDLESSSLTKISHPSLVSIFKCR